MRVPSVAPRLPRGVCRRSWLWDDEQYHRNDSRGDTGFSRHGGWEHQHEDVLSLSSVGNRRLRRAQASHATPKIGIAGDSSGVLDKTVFSPKIRMIFMVGLEGSGHHLMTNVLGRVCQSGGVVCPAVCPIADTLFNSIGCASTTSEYERGVESLRNEMDALALTLDGFRGGEDTVLLNFHDCPGRTYHVGMMSFPNFHGPDKPLQYVDLRLLAEEAERINVDLRMIYLGRPAKDIMVSTTMHREFGSYAHEARVLITNAAVIESSLNEMARSYVTCFLYDWIPDPAQANRVAEFVMPTKDGAANFANILLTVVETVSPSSESAEAADRGQALMSSRLQEKIMNIERARCH